MSVIGDNPIQHSKEDLLGRDKIATSVVRQIRSADTREGYVLGVVGPWGSGKTSLLNLMSNELTGDHGLTVINFNPWMFSGTDQLVEAFFHELASQLKETGSSKFTQISTTIDRYAEIFSPITMVPVVGAWYERAQKVIKAVKKYGDGKSPSIGTRKSELNQLLHELDHPIVVTIDDIDRLNSEEIRSLFKLVRLTGNFPNIVYVLAFDRQRVEAALTSDGIEGRAYLEKIVQYGFYIPELSQQKLLEQLGKALDVAIGEVDADHFDEARWQDQVIEIVLPLVRNMRDIRRYTVSAASTARELAKDIDLGDVLSMEAIRVFRPDRFDRIVKARNGLTTNASDKNDPTLKSSVENILVAGEDDTNDVIRSLIERTFPLGVRHIGGTSYAAGFTSTWLRARRMAHPGILSLYLERVMPEEIAEFVESERLYALMDDKIALEEHFESVEPSMYSGVISSLETFENEFTQESVVPASIVLSNLVPAIPKAEKRGFLDFGDPELRVSRIVLRLFKRLDSKEAVMSAVEQILPELNTLSAKFSIVSLVGYRDGVGHRLVSEVDATTLENSFVKELDATSLSELSNEWDLLRLLSTPLYWGIRSTPVVADFSVPSFHAEVLRQARSEIVSQGMGSRAISRRYTMHWESLKRIYGNELGIEKAIQCVRSWRAEKDEALQASLDLAEKYLSGWRPERL